jgi:hypothetical protein
MNLRDILAPLERLLKQYHVPYAVIGGYAVAAWGEVRATRDIELLCHTRDLEVVKQPFAARIWISSTGRAMRMIRFPM